MTEIRYFPVMTAKELETLDAKEVREGYNSGIANDSFPFGKSKAFWHGWRNGKVDGGWRKKDMAMARLAHETMPILARMLRK